MNKINIHKNIIKKYESISVSASWDNDDLDYLLSEIQSQFSAQFHNAFCILFSEEYISIDCWLKVSKDWFKIHEM